MARAKKKTGVSVITENRLRKKYPNANRATIVLNEEGNLWLPSSNIAMNWLMGGGIPYGRIVEVFGYESSGKTLLAIEFSKSVQALEGIVLWGDAEHSFTNYWAEQNGLNPSQIELFEDNGIEAIADWAMDIGMYYRKKLIHNEPILLVVDSIAACETKDNQDGYLMDQKAEMGNRAKAWDAFYRKRNPVFHKLGICVIMINQIRGKIGATMFELAETTPGGKAAGFYASIRVSITGGKQIKDEQDRKIGKIVTMGIRKNKVAPPRNSIKSELYFTGDNIGFSKYLGLPEILLEEGVVHKSGNRILYKDRVVGRSLDNFLENLKENSKMRKALISKANINTISKLREKLLSIDTNLFPITADINAEE